MAPVPQYAWAIDQAGVKLPAAIMRGQHYDSTSGGTGVGSPRALKVLPQAAPDNTVMILPGGGTAVSTYAGHENQSYQATNFKPQTLEIPPTGSSSGGRTDLIIQRWLDPNEEPHPDYDGEYPIPAEIAKDLWYWRFECKPGMDRTARLDYPHVKLSELNRPANTTIVNESHITDLRELADPQSKTVPLSGSLTETKSASRTGNYVTFYEFLVDVPEWANRAAVTVGIGGVAVRGDGPALGHWSFSGFGHGASNDRCVWHLDASSINFQRIPYIQASGALAISDARRGSVQSIYAVARVSPDSSANSQFSAGVGVRVFADVVFMQEVE